MYYVVQAKLAGVCLRHQVSVHWEIVDMTFVCGSDIAIYAYISKQSDAVLELHLWLFKHELAYHTVVYLYVYNYAIVRVYCA